MKNKKYSLRAYQQRALEMILWSLKLEGNSLVCIPVGGGKTHVISALVHQLNQKVLILTPSREILMQDFEKLAKLIPAKDLGIYSAGLSSKQIRKITLATIQSVYRKPELFRHFSLVIIDECDLVNPRNLEGMFTKFLKEIGNPRCIGLTASPYRIISLGRGRGYGITLINRMREFFWQRLLYNVSTRELTEQGYLVPFLYLYRPLLDQQDIPINKAKNDYNLTLYEEKIATQEEQIEQLISYAMREATATLVFCSSIKQAQELSAKTPGSTFVTGKTGKKERTKIIADFKGGKTKIVFNVGVLTMGFDHPALDCILLLRPTRSIRLLVQMLGRGSRTAPGKKNCLVIDATDSIRTIGRLETIEMQKVEGKWNVVSEVRNNWHRYPLYMQPVPQFTQRSFRPETLLNRYQLKVQ